MLFARPARFFNKKKASASRTYMNHIHVMTNKFANWDPAIAIELGDYGEVERETGTFIKKANIYTDGKTGNLEALTKKTGPLEDTHTVVSLDALQIAFNGGPEAEIPGVAEAVVKAQFKFTRRNGAALLMYKTTTSVLDGDIDAILHGTQYEHLRGMCLVREVVTCQAYAMYLAGSHQQVVKLVLRGNLPVAHAVGATAGAGVGVGWITEGVSGVFRSGSQQDQSYTTLYSLVTIGQRKHTRRELHPPDPATLGIDCWMETIMPWNMLDEEGEELDEGVAEPLSDSDEDDD